MSQLRRVDSLNITFLVDNTIEWMTRLPPGFTHEMKTHLSQKPEKTIGDVPVMNFDRFCCGAHGFSALIETTINGELKTYSTLFDSGPDSLSLPRNIDGMEVDVNAIDRIVLSHWHSDHSGGILSFLKLRNNVEYPCIVDLHPNRPMARGIAPPPHTKVVSALAIDPTFEEIETAGGKVEKHAEGHAVAGDTVWVSGEIPRVSTFEDGILGGRTWTDKNEWVKDELIMDERYAVIDVYGKGLVIFSACSHAGIVNVVKDAVAKFSRPVHMVIGGLHLAGPELAYRIQPTVDYLSKELRPAPTYVLPMHCTGFRAKIALEEAFGEGCVPAGVGHKVKVDGSRDFDARLSLS